MSIKRLSKKNKGVVKGAPSGFVISLLVHAAAFSLAGLLVVFSVVNKEEKKFVPPKPVDRPKMKLKKPKVKVKKSAKPKSTTRIVTKVKRASMPDIQLPEMSGLGDGLAGDIGGFDIMPDLDEVTLFGGGQTIGADLEGTFYDLKRTRSGSPLSVGTDPDDKTVDYALAQFIRKGWRSSALAKYYRSPKKLYATTVMVPLVSSFYAPPAFGESTSGYAWAVHYKGQLVHHKDIRFRFWGQADDIMVVRVDGKVVLDASRDGHYDVLESAHKWSTSDSQSRQHMLGNLQSMVGDWITLEAGMPQDLDVLFAEVPGGEFCAMLLVEVEGVEYEENFYGAPILPIFKTAQLTHELIDRISEHLVPGEASITSGPVFSDIDFSRKSDEVQVVALEPSVVVDVAPEPESSLRVWNTTSGQSIEAEFISSIGEKVILKSAKGKQIKVTKDSLIPSDKKFIDLSNPPKLSVDFIKKSDNQLSRYPLSPSELQWNRSAPRVNDWSFGARVRKTSAGAYSHILKVEYFALGQQLLDPNKYMLLDRQSGTYIPSEENEFAHEIKGEPVEMVEFNLRDEFRGRKYAENLVLVTDERGEIVAHSTSAKWLYAHLENLEKLPVGAYMDKECNRVHPTGPKPNY